MMSRAPTPARRSTRIASLLLLAFSAAACAADLQDSPPMCSVNVIYSPDLASPSATQPIRATAEVANYQGIARYRWRVLRDEAELPFEAADPDVSSVEFLAAVPGVYRVELRVDSASDCPMYAGDVNVLPAGASQREYRLRVTPPPGSPSTGPQEQRVSLFSGVDYSIPSRALLTAEARVRPVLSGSSPVAAYLRFTPVDGEGLLTEVSSGADGRAEARLTPGDYQVVVVPQADRAPYRIARWRAAASANEAANEAAIDGPPGEVTSGSVRDPDNAPVAGARVSVKVDGLPATVAVTGADGSFSLRVSTGSSMELAVVPPPGLGLPRLVGAAPLVAGQPLAVRYQGFTRRDVGGVQLRRQGALAPAGRVTFVGQLSSPAGLLNAAGPLRGEVLVTATAGADGRLPSTSLPQELLTAVVEPRSGELAVLAFDTTAAPPASLDAAAMQSATGVVRTSAAAAAPGAVVELIPQGALAAAGAPPTSVVAGAGGAFSAPVAPGGSYQASITDPERRGTSRLVAVPASRALGAVSLGRGWKVTSKLTSLSPSPARAISVELYCVECSAEERQRPLSSAVTDEGGAFSLLVPD